MNISTFFPYEKFIIKTNIDSSEIIRRISSVIEPPKTFRFTFSGSEKPYEGKIEGYDFRINRIINYRNSFLPFVHGKIQWPYIEITMRMHRAVEVFIIIWMSIAAMITIPTFISLCYAGTPEIKILVAGVAMIIFTYLLCTVGFKLEAKKTKKFLYDLLLK